MQAHEEDANYSNPVKASVFTDLEIVFAYTNISFTEKQKEDIPKLYDMICSSGLLIDIMNAIPEEEKECLFNGVNTSIEAIYKYQNSVLGIVDALKNSANEINIKAEEIEELKQAALELSEMPLIKQFLQ
jgi:hypothetical protein